MCALKTMLQRVCVGLLGLLPLAAVAQQDFDEVEIEVLPVRDNIYMHSCASR